MADDEKFRVSLTVDTAEPVNNIARLSNLMNKLVIATNGEDKALVQLQRTIDRYAGSTSAAAAATDKNAQAKARLAQSDNLVQRAAQGQSLAIEQLGRAQGQAIEMNKKFDEQNTRSTNSIRSLGYETLVLGSILGTVGTQLLGFAGAAVNAGVQYERAFANVIRTSSDGSLSIDNLRKSLIQLTTEIPETFANITEIAALGGQLGIAGTGITNFTSVVARLTATTDLTAEAAGTALGRFQALVGLPTDKFENLASAILKVGVNSVATESQIVAISTQISSMADFAGFTADQIVGLAGALASVGAAPELSRGTITRTFSLISKAIATSSEDLDEFARISGVSSTEFVSAFGTARFAPVFQSFLANLGQMQERGENVVITLNNLGITSVRDVPLLLRLAGATDTVTKTFADAAQGFADATELQEQYGIIATTTASRIQLLVNNVQNFLAAVGGAATGPISDFVDVLSEVVKAITDFISTPVGQKVALITLAVSALAGVLLTLVGVVSFAAGTFLLLSSAASSLGFNLNIAAFQTKNATISLIGLRGAASSALAALGPLALIVGALSIAFGNTNEIQNFAQDLYGIDSSVSAASDRLTDLQKTVNAFDLNKLVKQTTLPFLTPLGFNTDNLNLNDIKGATKEFESLAAAGRSVGAAAGFGDFAKVDESIAALVESGNITQAKTQFDQLKKTADELGISQEVFNALFPDTINGLKGVSVESFATAQANYELAASEEAAADAAEELATKLGLTPDALKALQEGIQQGSESFFGFGDIITALQDKQKAFAQATADDTEDSTDSWQSYYDGSSVALSDFAASLQGQIDSQQAWADDLSILAARGATGFVTELAKLGPAGAQVAAQAVDATTEELNKIEANAQLAAFLASDAFAQEFVNQTPALIEAYRNGGIEGVKALIDANLAGAPGVAAAVTTSVNGAVSAGNAALSKNPIVAQIQTKAAEDRLKAFYATAEARSITIPVDAYVRNVSGGVTLGGNYVRLNQVAVATGGYIRGPGTGTSDSVPARLSNGEYVIRAASVSKYGSGLFDQLNRGVAKFATGGPVNGSRPSAVQAQLSPPDRAALRGAAGGSRTIQLVVDGRVLAEAVDNANNNNQFTGSN